MKEWVEAALAVIAGYYAISCIFGLGAMAVMAALFAWWAKKIMK